MAEDVSQDEQVTSTRIDPPAWAEGWDERVISEIMFARFYVRVFNHGTVGHNMYHVIDKLATALDERSAQDGNQATDATQDPA